MFFIYPGGKTGGCLSGSMFIETLIVVKSLILFRFCYRTCGPKTKLYWRRTKATRGSSDFEFHYLWSQHWRSLLWILSLFVAVPKLRLVPPALSRVMLDCTLICLCFWILYVCHMPYLLWNPRMFVVLTVNI